MFLPENKRKGCRRANADSHQKSPSQDNRSTKTILPHIQTNASCGRRHATKSKNCQWVAEGQLFRDPHGEIASPGSSSIPPIERRATQIIMSASTDLLALARAEQSEFPHLVRLLIAMKQAVAKVSIELVSLGVSYPDVSVVVALLAVGWFYVSAKVEA